LHLLQITLTEYGAHQAFYSRILKQLSLGIKHPGHEPDPSPLSNAEAQNEWSECISLFPHVFMASTSIIDYSSNYKVPSFECDMV
jgi:hypothetical protein